MSPGFAKLRARDRIRDSARHCARPLRRSLQSAGARSCGSICTVAVIPAASATPLGTSSIWMRSKSGHLMPEASPTRPSSALTAGSSKGRGVSSSVRAPAPRSRGSPHGRSGTAARAGAGSYAPAFRDNDVDGEVLPKLMANDLVGLGVTSIGHRQKLLDAIAALGAEAPATRPPGRRPRRYRGVEQALRDAVDLYREIGATGHAERLARGIHPSPTQEEKS